jgi:hypothetical protein
VIVILEPDITGLFTAEACDYAGKGVRPQYFDCETQKEMFKELPRIPEDFYEVKNLFLYRFVNLTGKILEEEYWKQPEWFPNYADKGGALDAVKNYIKQAQESGMWRTTIWCAGIYPSDFYAKTKAGRNITVYTWVRNAPHQFKYEGIQLVKVYPLCDSFEERGFELGNNTVCQDPEYVKENVKISITPNLLLLTPNFPTYTYNHTKIIKVGVNISENMAPGRYVVGFNTELPPEWYNQQYYMEYGFDYTGSVREFHCAPGPQYRLFIDVEE